MNVHQGKEPVGARLGGSLRRPAAERTANYTSMAIGYAAYRVLLDLFPSQSSNVVKFMGELGSAPNDTSTDPATPQGIGNLAAQAVLDYRHHDGANHLGDEPDRTGPDPTKSYSDWTAMCRSTPGIS